jgi:hypothetical protein
MTSLPVLETNPFNLDEELLKVIEAADAGDAIADASLRVAGCEFLDRWEWPPALLLDYLMRKVILTPDVRAIWQSMSRRCAAPHVDRC